jgi:hypothetical protein
MLLQSLNNLAPLATLIVIAVAAFAAVVQLRHLRASNQLSGLLTILHYSQDPEEQKRRDYVLNDLETRLQDADFRKSLMEHPVDPSVHIELKVCDFFEQVGNYLKRGLIDESAYLDTACDFVETMWEKLEPVIAIMRRTRDETLYDNFEYLTARARLWSARHPRGNYPQSTRRVAIRDSWLITDNAASRIGQTSDDKS